MSREPELNPAARAAVSSLIWRVALVMLAGVITGALGVSVLPTVLILVAAAVPVAFPLYRICTLPEAKSVEAADDGFTLPPKCTCGSRRPVDVIARDTPTGEAYVIRRVCQVCWGVVGQREPYDPGQAGARLRSWPAEKPDPLAWRKQKLVAACSHLRLTQARTPDGWRWCLRCGSKVMDLRRPVPQVVREKRAEVEAVCEHEAPAIILDGTGATIDVQCTTCGKHLPRH